MINKQDNIEKWTWADLASSYRFWAIVILFLLFAISDSFFNSTTMLLRASMGLSNRTTSVIYQMHLIGFTVGFILAWLASRLKSYYFLYITGAIYLLAIALNYYTYTSYNLLFLGFFLRGLSSGLVIMIIPAYIANAVKSTEVFILSFGVLSILKLSISAITLSISFILLDKYPPTVLFITMAVPIIIAMLLLIPVKKCLFNEVPRIREVTPTPPCYCHPLIVLLLFFVPFYFIYWFVKVHREIRTFTQSPTLLTPFAAGWCCLLVPLGIPIILSSVNDEMGLICEREGQRPSYKAGLVILLAVFLPPIGAALVQSQLNQLNQENI